MDTIGMAGNRKTRAFSLLELSIGLTIISILAAGALTVGGVMVEQQQFVGSNERVGEAKKAIRDYFTVNGRLPCPARRADAPGSANFGVEVNCAASGAAPAGTSRVNSAGDFTGAAYGAGVVRIGVLPVRTLGLRDNAMADEYGNRILYAMTERFADSSQIADATGAITLRDGNNNAIATGSSSNGAVFVVLSTGPDGKGGYRYSTGNASGTCSGGLDTENCNNDIIFRDTRFNNGTVAASFFDDMVAWVPKYLISDTGGGRAAGSTGQVQYNNGGYLAANANFFWDITNARLGIGTSAPAHPLHIAGNASGAAYQTGLQVGSAGTGRGPLYLVHNTPHVAGNTYYNAGWKYGGGVGRPSHIGLTNGILFHVSNAAVGSAGAAVTDMETAAMTLDSTGNLFLGSRAVNGSVADGWGPAFFIDGATSINTDAIYFRRHNHTADGSNLYLQLGDNFDGMDNFIINSGPSYGTNTRFIFTNSGWFRQIGGGIQMNYDNPSIHFQDTDHRSATIHVNSNQFYVLRGKGVNTTESEQYDGQWPLTISLDNNTTHLGGHTNIYSSLNICQKNHTGCYLRFSDDGYFADNNTTWTDYYNNNNGGLRLNSPLIVKGKPSWHAQTAAIIDAPHGSAYYQDWPAAWGGGLVVWDILGSSTYFTHYLTRSDRRYKKDITPLETGKMVDAVMQLKPVSYHYKDEHSTPNLHYGFIAQDVRDVMPDLVTGKESKTERLGLNYDGFLAPIVATLQVLKQEQDRVKEAVENAAPAPGGPEAPAARSYTIPILLGVSTLQFLLWVIMGFRLRQLRAQLSRLQPAA